MNWRLLCCFSLLTFFTFAKDAKDLEKFYTEKINAQKHDSLKIKLLFDWDDEIYLENPDLDIKLNTQVIDICRAQLKKSKLKKEEFRYFSNNLARALNNKGLALSAKNKLNEALDLLDESYRIAKKYHFKLTESHSTNNIGTIYLTMKDYHKAIEYYEKSLTISKDSASTPETFNNIGLCYSDLKDTTKARIYFQISLKFSLGAEHELNKANTLLNLADLYQEQNDLEKAFLYFNLALENNKQINNPNGISYCYSKIANLLRIQKKYPEAIKHGLLAYKVAKEHELLFYLTESCNALYKTYKDLNDTKKALYYYELFIQYYDKNALETNKEELIKQEYYYEYKNKEEIAQTKHNKELEIASEKNKRQKVILIFVVLTLIGFLIFSFFVIRSYRKTKKMNELIANQKKEVEYKNKEIMDSITYAKRIQTAILPTDQFFKSKFSQSFILYIPKDIVAGDFYWMEEMENLLIFAVADCTGHGVPGAMVSVVCHNALNRCIREFKLTNPNEILNKTRELIIHEFEKSNEEMKDGMDISLCCLELDTLKMTWAGANNPLCFIRDEELIEIKGDKQPIGNYAFAKDFSLHEIQMQKGDAIYLFSDGYVDQFGSELTGSDSTGKKFKSKRLKSLLIGISSLNIDEQKRILKEEFYSWKGAREQVDDICIIGIKL